jgi:hypothetical protein
VPRGRKDAVDALASPPQPVRYSACRLQLYEHLLFQQICGGALVGDAADRFEKKTNTLKIRIARSVLVA